MIESRNFEAGHVIPWSKGGPTQIYNLRCICVGCNRSMGNKNLNDFKHAYYPDQEESIPMDTTD